jgi:hypothetical protein
VRVHDHEIVGESEWLSDEVGVNVGDWVREREGDCVASVADQVVVGESPANVAEFVS